MTASTFPPVVAGGVQEELDKGMHRADGLGVRPALEHHGDLRVEQHCLSRHAQHRQRQVEHLRDQKEVGGERANMFQ